MSTNLPASRDPSALARQAGARDIARAPAGGDAVPAVGSIIEGLNIGALHAQNLTINVTVAKEDRSTHNTAVKREETKRTEVYAPQTHTTTAPQTHTTIAPQTHATYAPQTHTTCAPQTHYTSAPQTHSTYAPTIRVEPLPAATPRYTAPEPAPQGALGCIGVLVLLGVATAFIMGWVVRAVSDDKDARPTVIIERGQPAEDFFDYANRFGNR